MTASLPHELAVIAATASSLPLPLYLELLRPVASHILQVVIQSGYFICAELNSLILTFVWCFQIMKSWQLGATLQMVLEAVTLGLCRRDSLSERWLFKTGGCLITIIMAVPSERGPIRVQTEISSANNDVVAEEWARNKVHILWNTKGCYEDFNWKMYKSKISYHIL